MPKSVLVDKSSIGISKSMYSKGFAMEPHAHDFTSISVIFNGAVQEQVADNLCFSGISQVLVKPAGVEHSNIFNGEVQILNIALKDIEIHKIDSAGLLENWSAINGANSLPYLIAILQEKSEKEQHELLKAFVTHLSVTTENNAYFRVPDWLNDVRLYLDEHFTEPVKSSDLAQQFNVHPVYLARVFRKHFGQTIKSYLKSLRLHGSIASMHRKKQMLTQVALDNGYSDQSHFNRHFKDELDLTPKQYQRLVS